MMNRTELLVGLILNSVCNFNRFLLQKLVAGNETVEKPTFQILVSFVEFVP
jgi:hypothetical protein